MKFKKLSLRNFKSIADQDIYFEDLNILAGANASGKSNIVSAFCFIDHIIKYGIDEAISLSGA